MQETISVRQLNAMVFIFLVSDFAIFEPRAVADAAGGQVLISVALATLVGILLTGVWFTLARRFPGIDVVRYSSVLLGTPLGQVAGTVYLFMLLIGAARSTAKVGTIGEAAFGWGAAVAVPVILLVVVALFLLTRRGLKTIASLCEYAAPVVIVLVAVAGLTVLAKANWANYTFLATGWGPAVRGALSMTGRFSVAWVVLLLLPRTRNVQNTTILSTMGTVLLVGLLMAVGTLSVALYGARATAASFIPSLQLITDSIWGRNPAVLNGVVALWMLGLALKGGAAYWLLSTTLAKTSSVPTVRFLVPVGVATFVLALVIWNDPAQTYIFLRQGHRYFLYLAGIGIPLLLLLVAWLRGRRPVQTATQT
ncbi:MAG TPA: GerAB/ArcD/ProY family transporter [Spirochaetia bacterium]|nr:GerAB/ArcD/ProY family transporter [Spirochaetia bacterium]